jgi:hypothetical protein
MRLILKRYYSAIFPDRASISIEKCLKSQRKPRRGFINECPDGLFLSKTQVNNTKKSKVMIKRDRRIYTKEFKEHVVAAYLSACTISILYICSM